MKESRAVSRIAASGGCQVQQMPLNQRTYDCPEFGLSIDRDLNASINLKKRVLIGEVSYGAFKVRK
ncbi:zinc ribbon domain-containing protein [Okeania sp. SIO1I7]|uniref:zinc ribbon domain-containing protein n=1 Tax=Okeania sp. SIO1I7 TaxID=2607772 RepID=UPI003456C3C8